MGIKRGNMKSPFFKSLLVAGALLLAWNCTDDTTIPTNLGPLSDKAESVWVINIGENNNLYIAEDGTVYDTQWNVFGTFSEGNIVTSENEIFMVGVDTTNRPMAKVIVAADGTKMVEFDDGTVTDTEGNEIGTVDDSGNIVNENGEVIAESPTKPTVTSSASGTNPTSAGTNPGTNPGGNSAASTSSNSSGTHNTPTSSAAAQQGGQCDGQCYDAPSGKCVAYYDNQRGPHDEQYAYDKTCTLNCYYDPNSKDCKDMGGGTVTPSSSGSQQPKSSSSKQQTQSSSSKNQTQSSSSKANGTTPNFKIKNGGKSGQGWGSRYWDCCKPHCAWSGKGGPIARTCNAQGQQLTKGDDNNKSICDGGNAGVCSNQAPFVVNDNLAYAFAAGPGNEYAGKCGSCFLLTFNGSSQHTTDARTQALKGKQMVIMISNIGYDVNGNQFDIMIPGGGVGAFDGCNPLWGIDQEARDGGFLKSCGGDKKLESSAAVSQVQSCLEQKCNSKFASKPEAKAGCLFHAQWLMAANNPQFTFQELESCPSELEARY
ncbi:MAG: hypothetical protein IJ909_12070 [Fibrobacter sp.]|nr:hypothetical protein [Fibrobacter sp.]